MTVSLRPYQTESIQALYDYFAKKSGNPLVVLPTGSGKSLTMAAFIQGALAQYPATRIILLTHVKELIEQDAKAIIRYWPQAPVGIWSAGVGVKQKEQITVAGIQSVHKLPAKFGGTDLVLIDEAHLVSKRSDTMYGRFIDGLRSYNPNLKVIGFTATPYRMDSGLLTDGEHRIFTDVAYEADVGELIKRGYLCPLTAKNGQTKADLSGVHVRGGEFVESELQDAMNHDELINGAFDEVANYASDRQHILGFCAGIAHSMRCAELAVARGWTADYVTGEMSKTERTAKIEAFTSGRIRFLFNAMLLTTGFDYPAIDCILGMRPTKSTGLYVQIMGRGLRLHDSKTNTLVLDFAGNIEQHGPIDQIRIKRKHKGKGEGVSVAPVKECPKCHELVHTAVMECPGCGHVWVRDEVAPHSTQASSAVIVAAIAEPVCHAVDRVEYRKHEKSGKPPSLRVTYHCGLSTFDEYVPIEDFRPFVYKYAVKWFWSRGLVAPKTVDEALSMVNQTPAPDTITVRLNGKYWHVTHVEMGRMRLGISKVVASQPGKAFWEFAA